MESLGLLQMVQNSSRSCNNNLRFLCNLNHLLHGISASIQHYRLNSFQTCSLKTFEIFIDLHTQLSCWNDYQCDSIRHLCAFVCFGNKIKDGQHEGKSFSAAGLWQTQEISSLCVVNQCLNLNFCRFFVPQLIQAYQDLIIQSKMRERVKFLLFLRSIFGRDLLAFLFVSFFDFLLIPKKVFFMKVEAWFHKSINIITSHLLCKKIIQTLQNQTTAFSWKGRKVSRSILGNPIGHKILAVKRESIEGKRYPTLLWKPIRF